jgi:hypothetical protein
VKKYTLWMTSLLAVTLVMVASVVLAQFNRFSSPASAEPSFQEGNDGFLTWKTEPGFEEDVFTFVRIHYSGWGRGGGWRTDWPDSDRNFLYRLQELTAIKTNPREVILRLDDPELLNYPFIYIIEPGGMELNEAEVQGLRKYLLNGGFLMVDDFWGGDEYNVFYENIKRVFPNREPVELPIEHPIFHIVYDLKEKPQVPSIGWARDGRVHESRPGPDDGSVPHYRAIFDDEGRMMAIICHNTDLGDGWEREGENHEYFKEFSEKKAYPMGINIVVYAMTH